MIGALRRLDPTSGCDHLGLTNPNMWSTSVLSHFFFFFFFFFCRLHAYACMYVLQATYAKITSVFVAHSGRGLKS